MYKRIRIFLMVVTLCFFSLVGCSSEDASQIVNQTNTVEVENESANTKSTDWITEKETTQSSIDNVTEAIIEEVKEVLQTEAPAVKEIPEQRATEAQEVAQPNNSGGGKMVWIPNSGKKYHSSPSCSNMKNPSQVSIDTAISRGYTPCSKCY